MEFDAGSAARLIFVVVEIVIPVRSVTEWFVLGTSAAAKGIMFGGSPLQEFRVKLNTSLDPVRAIF